ncbi:MAG: ankyrin repeat domain-containing protein [Candidatus Thiodiazotropha sp. (ex. Lucinoma kazani)]
MYLDYFKLGCRPFNITPDPDYFCLTTPVQQTCDHIHEAIQRHAPVLLLSGAPGTGKTALLKHLLAKGNSGTIHWVFIDRAQLHADDLLMLIGESLGISVKGSLSGEGSEQIRNRMRAFEGVGVNPVIILDEADHLACETLEEILDWHASIRIQGVSSTLILAGLPQLVQKIEDRDHVLFAPPWGDHFTLKQFDFREMHTVITHCLKIAGYDGPRLFDNEALRFIFALSDGVPRVIMHICDLCLFCTANMQRRRVTREVVEEVSRFILLDEDTSVEFEIDSDPLFESANASLPMNPTYTKKQGPAFHWLRDGLLAMLGTVAVWIMWPGESPEILNNRQSAGAPSSSERVGKVEHVLSPSTESMLRVESTGNVQTNPSKKINSVIDPANDSPWLVMGVEQSNKKLLELDHVIHTPSDRNDLKMVNLVEKTIENKPHSLMNKTNPVQPVTEMVDIDPQPDPLFGESSKTKPDIRIENRLQTVLATEAHQEDDSSRITINHSDKSLVEILPEKPVKERVIVVSPQIQKPAPPLEHTTLAALEMKTSRISISKTNDRKRSQNVNGSNNVDLIKAVVKGDRQAIQKLLDIGASVDSVSKSGETALMKAAWAGRSELVDLIVSQRPSINKQNKEGWSALFYAAVRGHHLIVSSLLEHGAKVDLADQDGRTPLMAAAWNGHTQVVELLLNQGVSPNRKNRDGWSPLMFAALKGHIEVARLLIRHGADISSISHDGETSAELAAQQGHNQLVSLLAKE